MATMAKQRFNFDLSFDTPHAAAAAVRADDIRAPRYSEEDLAKARADAHAKGHAAGHAAALGEREHHVAQALAHLSQEMAGISKAQARSENARTRDAMRFAALLVRKVAPHLLALGAEDRIAALVREYLPRIQEEPRIVIRVAEDAVDPLKSRIEAIARDCAFEGRMIFLGQPDMRAGDCLIEWADGGIAARGEAFLAEIDGAVARFLAALEPPPVPADAPAPAPVAGSSP